MNRLIYIYKSLLMDNIKKVKKLANGLFGISILGMERINRCKNINKKTFASGGG